MHYVNFFRLFCFTLAVLLLPVQHGYGQETKIAKPVIAEQPVIKGQDDKLAASPATEPVVIPVANEAITRAKRFFEALRKELETTGKSVNSPTATIEDLINIRGALTDLRQKIAAERGLLTKPIANFEAHLKELGPKPEKGKTEAASITAQRESLNKTSNSLKAALKQFDLLGLEAGQLTSKTSELQKAAFVERVFVSRKSIINPQLWLDFTPTLLDAGTRTANLFQSWVKSASTESKISGIASLAAILAVYSFAVLLVFYVWSNMARPPEKFGEASNLRRVWRSIGGIAVVSLIGVLAITLCLAILSWSAVEYLRISRVVTAVGEVIFAIAVMLTILRAVIAPSDNQWRLVNINDQTASQLFRYALSAVVVFAVDRGASAFADITFLPLEFVVGEHGIVSILLIVILAKIISTSRNATTLVRSSELSESRSFYFNWSHLFFLPSWILLIISALALLLGYIALAHFILTTTLLTAAMIVILYLIHHLVDALVSSSTQPWSWIGKSLRRKMGFGDENIRRLGLLLSTITDISVILLGMPLILALWTITWVDFSSLATQAFFGFKVGSVFIEPSKVFLAVIILIIGIIVIRVLSLWLNRRILGRSNIEAGVQNSIATGVRYTGILLVAGFALSAAGLDFSKLAIVAGALSVGIGFGLQSVVSNFVSGLILLAERPIRIGDWIEVGAGEGEVKKINVRSTEIQTFDRCSVIVPNSSLISDPVKNWSHGSPVGRIKINVGVGYDSAPEIVQEVLLKCAMAHETVIASPPPRVIFMDFGASSLDFQLRVFLSDIAWCTSVASDLRFAIFRELKAAGIEIPFPQRDINIRDADKLAQAFAEKPPVRKAPARKPRKAVKK